MQLSRPPAPAPPAPGAPRAPAAMPGGGAAERLFAAADANADGGLDEVRRRVRGGDRRRQPAAPALKRRRLRACCSALRMPQAAAAWCSAATLGSRAGSRSGAGSSRCPRSKAATCPSRSPACRLP